MSRKTLSFNVCRARDSQFQPGLRDFFEYRKLGIEEATKGAVGAQIIRATQRCEDGTGKHTHGVDFQMVYVLKGKCLMWYEGQGEVELEAGDCVHQPPGIAHELRRCSEDCEALEITMPGVFATDPA